MDITANQSVETKEPWWKAITSFWSISKNDTKESEINEVVKQQDNKYINQLEKNVNDVGIEKSIEKKSKTSKSPDMESKILEQQTQPVKDKGEQEFIDSNNEITR